MKKLLFLVPLMVLLAAACSQTASPQTNNQPVQNQQSQTPPANQQVQPSNDKQVVKYESRKENGLMVLYAIYSDGSSQKTGLAVAISKAGTFEVPVNIVVSPDKTKAVFNKWKDVYMEIFVSDINGANVRKIAQQEVPEGSGELNSASLKWLADNKFITYQESATGNYGTLPSGDPDLRKVLITYQVNVATGAGKELSTEIQK